MDNIRDPIPKLDNTVLLLRGLISQYPADQQKAIYDLAESFRSKLKEAGDIGPLAFSLVGAEMQAAIP